MITISITPARRARPALCTSHPPQSTAATSNQPKPPATSHNRRHQQPATTISKPAIITSCRQPPASANCRHQQPQPPTTSHHHQSLLHAGTSLHQRPTTSHHHHQLPHPATSSLFPKSCLCPDKAITRLSYLCTSHSSSLLPVCGLCLPNFSLRKLYVSSDFPSFSHRKPYLHGDFLVSVYGCSDFSVLVSASRMCTMVPLFQSAQPVCGLCLPCFSNSATTRLVHRYCFL